MTLQPYAGPERQAWLRLWVSLYGPGSMLCRYVEPHEPYVPPAPEPEPFKPEAKVPRPNGSNGSTPALPRPSPRPLSPAKVKVRPSRPRVEKPRPSPAERAERRIARDIDRTTRLPISDWAKSIVGDERYASVTLTDILDGIEDYFEVFSQLKKVDAEAYKYFARVGAPIVMRNHGIWRSTVDSLTVANPAALPSYFGAFFSRTKEEYRDSILNDKSDYLDFHLFDKPKNHATVAAYGTTIFRHSEISLKRDAFSRAEMKKYPCTKGNWGVWWYIGVQADGQVRALPCRMDHYQTLPGGDHVHHSGFEIPQGLYEWAKDKGLEHERQYTPHDVVRRMFNATIAFAASAVSGVTVTIKRGKQAARFGLPVSALKNFFWDRDSEGRKKPIMHLRLSHDRHMRDGRVITVGEHLRGERYFSWRGYDIIVGVPGIHFPSPEGLDIDVWQGNDPDAPLPADLPGNLVSIAELGSDIREIMWRRRGVPIKRGEPTLSYLNATLPVSEERQEKPPADPA